MNEMIKRALVIKEAGSLGNAIAQNKIEQFQDISVSEAIVLGLLNQDVSKYIGIFGHGSTQIGEVLHFYQEAGIVSVYNVRHETEASHVAAALKWQYGETPVVFTSIGPGALQAFAGALVGVSNGLGIYYLFGDETSHDEGYNMQQVARNEQALFLKMMSTMGPSYTLHTPEAVPEAMRRGMNSVFNPSRPSPYFLLAPMNTQPSVLKNFNLLELPVPGALRPAGCSDEAVREAAEKISQYKKITVKAGRGALGVSAEVMEKFLELTGAIYTHGPAASGIIPASHKLNMGVGGAKGTISGNYAMENGELTIVIGARGVCQWDSSGTAWKKTKEIININNRPEDALHYNKTLPLVGDAETILKQLNAVLGVKSQSKEWHRECLDAREQWTSFKNKRYETPALIDVKREQELLTQPAAIKAVVDFAMDHDLAKIFDAGDVQANGFQIVEDEKPLRTFTETGASYMGYAVSALTAGGIAEEGGYSVAFTGDGSFMMNPQVLIDAVEHGAKGLIALFDNRRMAAISSLQHAQYGIDFRTDDTVVVDYIAMAQSVKGVKAVHGGYSTDELRAALVEAYAHDGLSVVYIPVYFGEHELGGLGAFGSWNVGNWCEDVQREKHRLGF